MAELHHPLATRAGLSLMVALLFGQGAMCPECGHGTRVTSKRWARCKKCGTRVRRRTAEWCCAELEAHSEDSERTELGR